MIEIVTKVHLGMPDSDEEEKKMNGTAIALNIVRKIWSAGV